MTVIQLAFRTDVDPVDPHADARRYVVEAIRHVAGHNGGVVSPNAVRSLLAAVGVDLPRGVVGATYRSMRRDGRLVPHGVERSDDVKGSNAGRLVETYRLTGGVA
jgi:hypothetical protein